MKQLNLHITYLLLILLCLSCENEIIVSSNLEKEESYFPLIIDSLEYEGIEMESDWLNTANYKIYYIGEEEDTIAINYRFNSHYLGPLTEFYYFLDDTIFYEERIPYQKYFRDWMRPSTHSINPDQANLKITVDTNQLVFNDGNIAYPVIVKNMDKDSVQIAYGDFIPIIMEAIDAEGNWMSIEEHWMYMCGNGVGSIILPPNEIVLTSAYKYYGKYKTLMRLKIGKNYSNSFLGTVNPKQFESMFDRHGEYKPEVKR